jgi:hypothetical protein
MMMRSLLLAALLGLSWTTVTRADLTEQSNKHERIEFEAALDASGAQIVSRADFNRYLKLPTSIARENHILWLVQKFNRAYGVRVETGNLGAENFERWETKIYAQVAMLERALMRVRSDPELGHLIAPGGKIELFSDCGAVSSIQVSDGCEAICVGNFGPKTFAVARKLRQHASRDFAREFGTGIAAAIDLVVINPWQGISSAFDSEGNYDFEMSLALPADFIETLAERHECRVERG